MPRASSASLVDVSALLERQDKMEAKLEARMQQQAEEAQAQNQALLRQMKEREDRLVQPVSDEQLASLQQRLETLHTAELLTDDEIGSLEDIIADYVVDVGRRAGPAAAADYVQQMALLSEAIAADRALARQLRRKFI